MADDTNTNPSATPGNDNRNTPPDPDPSPRTSRSGLQRGWSTVRPRRPPAPTQPPVPPPPPAPNLNQTPSPTMPASAANPITTPTEHNNNRPHASITPAQGPNIDNSNRFTPIADADDSSTQSTKSGTDAPIGVDQQGNLGDDNTAAVVLAPLFDDTSTPVASTFVELATTLEQAYPAADSSGTLFSAVRLFAEKADHLILDIEHNTNASDGIVTKLTEAQTVLNALRSSHKFSVTELDSSQKVLAKCESREKKIRTEHAESTKHLNESTTALQQIRTQLSNSQHFYDDLRKKVDETDRQSAENARSVREFINDSRKILSKQISEVTSTLGTVEERMKEMVSTSTVKAEVTKAIDNESSLRNKLIQKQQDASIREVEQACEKAIAGAIDKLNGESDRLVRTMGSTIASTNAMNIANAPNNVSTAAPSSDTDSGERQVVGAGSSNTSVGGGLPTDSRADDADDATTTSVGSRDPDGIHASADPHSTSSGSDEKGTTAPSTSAPPDNSTWRGHRLTTINEGRDPPGFEPGVDSYVGTPVSHSNSNHQPIHTATSHQPTPLFSEQPKPIRGWSYSGKPDPYRIKHPIIDVSAGADRSDEQHDGFEDRSSKRHDGPYDRPYRKPPPIDTSLLRPAHARDEDMPLQSPFVTSPRLSEVFVDSLREDMNVFAIDWEKGYSGDVVAGNDILSDADLRKLGVPTYPGGMMLRMLSLHSNIINRTKAVDAGRPPYNDGPGDEHRALKCTDWPRLDDMEPASFVDFYNQVAAVGAKYSLAMTPFEAINTRCEA